MEREDDKIKPSSTNKVDNERKSFSSNIKNAHASGDGSIQRSDETIDNPKDGSTQQEKPENTY